MSPAGSTPSWNCSHSSFSWASIMAGPEMGIGGMSSSISCIPRSWSDCWWALGNQHCGFLLWQRWWASPLHLNASPQPGQITCIGVKGWVLRQVVWESAVTGGQWSCWNSVHQYKSISWKIVRLQLSHFLLDLVPLLDILINFSKPFHSFTFSLCSVLLRLIYPFWLC